MRARSYGRIAAMILLPFLPVSMFAEVSISGLDDITIDAWAGSSSDIEGSDTYCALSCSNSCRFNRARVYDVAAYTSGPTDGAGNFYLSHDSSSATLPVTFEWTNPSQGTFEVKNYNSTFTTVPPYPYAPGATNCGQANSQNTITIRVKAADLASARAGTYSETFSIDMCRLQNGFTAECASPVAFSVNLPELIQLTQMKDFDFDEWGGAGDLETTQNFCVFRNGSGGFSLQATGEHNSGGRFHLSNNTETIPYDVSFRGSGSWYSSTPGVSLSSAATNFKGNSTRDCGGGTSHSMRVTVDENELKGAVAGTYTDTITLLVQPD